MWKKKIEESIDEYKLKQGTYRALSMTIKNTLEVLLKKNGFKYQIVAREKAPGSLRRKMEQRLPGVYRIDDVGDLAGCRVLFYLESDIKKFEKHLSEEVKVISKKKTNIPKTAIMPFILLSR